jgi:beta-lactam-binding protein with PASTA domain
MSNPPSHASNFLIAFFTALVTSVLTVLIVLRLGLMPGGGDVTVPDLTGSTKISAQATLEAKGLTLLVGGHKASRYATPGTVVSQNPLPGTKTNSGGMVTVVLAGEAPTVPDVTGRSTAEATLLIEQAGFKIVVGQPAPHDSIPKGKIASQVPAAGTSYEKGRSVTVMPSDGPAAVKVPKFVGMPVNRAKQAIVDAGFKVGQIRWSYNEDWAPYMVLNQEPAEGASAAPGSAIDLVVNED